MRLALAAIVTITLPLVGCQNDDATYTLYRNSVTDSSMRIHVATFDSTDGAAYNLENCNVAAGLYAAQPGVEVKFHCEKGRFK